MLEEALVAFQGNVIVVSHDRYFLNRICTAILAFEGDGAVRYTVGNYDYYLEKRASIVAKGANPGPAEAPKSAGVATGDRKVKPRKLTWKEQREFEGMEEAILAAENDVVRLEKLTADPDFFVSRAAEWPRVEAELTEARKRVAHLYERWEKLGAVARSASMETERSIPRQNNLATLPFVFILRALRIRCVRKVDTA